MDQEVLRHRALSPDVRFGRGQVESVVAALDRPFLLLTQPAVLQSLPSTVSRRAQAVEYVYSLAAVDLESLVSRLPQDIVVVAVGGGVVMDTAKYVAMKRGFPLYLCPSIVSADACVTNSVAVRRDQAVVYEGFIVADAILVDPVIISRAPLRLNRAGLGDILSIHTALWDWRRGAELGHAVYDTHIADQALDTFRSIAAISDQIAMVSDQALERIVRAFVFVNYLVVQAGHSQMQEGSEHYFAYAVEALTGRSFVHGEILGLGSVLMSRLQGNDPEGVVQLLAKCQVAWSPEDLGLSQDEVIEALVGLRDFVERTRLRFSVAHETTLSRSQAKALVADLG